MAYTKKSRNIQAVIKKGWTPDKMQNDDDYMTINISDRYGERIVEIKVICEEWEGVKAYKVYIARELWCDFTVNKKREYEYREV